MAYLASIAGSYFFLLFGANGVARGHGWTTVVGTVIVLGMTYICYRGIQISARLQYFLFGIEAVLLIVFSLVALVKVYSGHAPAGSIHPSISWFNPLSSGGLHAFATGLILALFIYWGWDSAVSVNEETTDRRHNPGRAAIFATLTLLAIYILTSIAAQAYGGVGTSGLGLANPIGALQTGILPTARTTLAMATYKALPDSFGRMNPKYQSPSVSTWFIGGTTAAIFVILTFVSHGAIQADSILCIGLLIAFYYGLVGFTCAWHFRSVLRNSPQDFVLKGLIPLFGAVVLAIAFVYSAIQMWAPGYGLTSFHGVGGVFLLGIGTLVLGVLVMLVYSVARPAFFRKGAIEQMEQLSNLDRATTE